MKAVVSIHDCMPETMARIDGLLGWLREQQLPPVTLLVVPGRDWSPGQIAHLRHLASLGHPLAAHGWHHHTTPRRLFHRCHAALISRNVAEHLALDPPDVLALMRRSHAWFEANDLPRPALYVPPAWALGALDADDLATLPFRAIETTRGVWLAGESGRPAFKALPLAGYEADTTLRKRFLHAWNRHQAGVASRRSLPLRISIHPDDRQLLLAGQLAEQLRLATSFVGYTELA